MKGTITKNPLFKWILAMIPSGILLLIPASESYTSDIKLFLAITIFVIACIALENLPNPVIGLVLPFIYIIVFKIDTATALKAWTMDTVWIILAALMIASVLQKTGLLQRIAYGCILLFGGSFRGILYGMALAGTVMAFLIPSATSRTVILFMLAVGICKTFELKMPGKASAAIGYAAFISSMNPSAMVLTSSNDNVIAFNLAAESGYVMTFTDFVIHNFIPQFIVTLVLVVIIDVFFKPGADEKIESKEYIKSEFAKLGKMSTNEWKMAVLCIILSVALLTTQYTGLSLPSIFILGVLIMFLPGINLATMKEFKEINYPLFFFVTGCLTVGIVSVELGVGQFIAQLVYPLISGSTFKLLTGTWLIGFIANFVMTPMAVVSAFTGMIIEFAHNSGVNAIPLVHALIDGERNLLLPYESALYLMGFGFGLMTTKQFFKFFLIRTIVAFAGFLLLSIPWWNLIHLL